MPLSNYLCFPLNMGDRFCICVAHVSEKRKMRRPISFCTKRGTKIKIRKGNIAAYTIEIWRVWLQVWPYRSSMEVLCTIFVTVCHKFRFFGHRSVFETFVRLAKLDVAPPIEVSSRIKGWPRYNQRQAIIGKRKMYLKVFKLYACTILTYFYYCKNSTKSSEMQIFYSEDSSF